MDNAFRREAYELLGVPEGASPEQVRRAYRALVKSWHPDRFVASPSRQAEATVLLRRINAAYALLMAPSQWRSARDDTEQTASGARRRQQTTAGRAFVVTARTPGSTRRAAHGPRAVTFHTATGHPTTCVDDQEARPDGSNPGGLPWGAIAFVCAVVLLGLLALSDPSFVEFLDYLDSAPLLDDPL